MLSPKNAIANTEARLLKPAGVICLFLVAACDVNDGPLEQAGAELDEAYEESTDRIEQASNTVEETMLRVDEAAQSFREDVNEFQGTSEAEIRDAQAALEQDTARFFEKAENVSSQARNTLEALAEDAVSNTEKSATAAELRTDK